MGTPISIKKPVIGIVCNSIPATTHEPQFFGAKRVYTNSDYINSILQAGGVPVLIPLSHDDDIIQVQIALCQGLLFTGGSDVSPCLYNADNHLQLQESDLSTDSAQQQIMSYTVSQEKPILAVCKGMQLLNVTFGGTLYQDINQKDAEISGQKISDPPLCHWQKSFRGDPCHQVHSTSGSIISSIFGNSFFVNSFHHQAVQRLADGFIATAHANDGTIEAIENPDSPSLLMGVQWHPEMMMVSSHNMLPLFKKLISCAARVK